VAGGLAGRAASLTLIAPGVAPKVGASLGVKIGVALTVLAAPRLRFPIPLGDVSLFTDHEPMREYLRTDPLQLHRATSRLLYVSRCLDRRLRRAPRGAVRTPTTLLLAETDRIVDNQRTRAIVAHLTAGAADTRVLPGCHSLEFEPDPQPLYDALRGAMDRAE
jgi:alpha-beta hydrolase superfamily lysophospholipase